MEKKYIVIAVVVVVLWASFMGYRHFKKRDENLAHRQDTYSRMVEMARKSPRGGLYEMAEALKRYYADNRTYPSDLGALYPKYMPSKAFIEEIAWNYEPSGDNFSLSKSATYNNQTIVASIDGAMRAEVQTSGGVMVATRKAPARKPPGEVAEGLPAVEEAISESMVLEVIQEREMTVKEVDVVTAAVSPELKREGRQKAADEKINVQNELSRIITLVGEEAVSAREAAIGYNLERYMVWKDLNGAIGISNVEFPDRTDMYVAVRNRWYNVKRRQPERLTEKAETGAAVPEKQKSNEEIAAGLSRNYLVWKNAGGSIGVGDTQYPDKVRLVVAAQGGWNELERPLLSETDAGVGVKADSPGKQDIDALAADISRQFLVWKNTDGSIGVGDTKYPERDRLEVASKGEWTAIRKEPLPEEKSGEFLPAPREVKKQLDEKLVDAGISGRYLVWKDKNGQIGFGNVEYPELQNVAYIHSGGGWQKVAN